MLLTPAPNSRPHLLVHAPDASTRKWAVNPWSVQALGYFAITLGLGSVMAFAPLSTWKLRLATAYAVCALLGFLGQMVLGVATRLFPVLVLMQAMARSGPPPHSPYRLASATIAAVELGTWSHRGAHSGCRPDPGESKPDPNRRGFAAGRHSRQLAQRSPRAQKPAAGPFPARLVAAPSKRSLARRLRKALKSEARRQFVSFKADWYEAAAPPTKIAMAGPRCRRRRRSSPASSGSSGG